MNAGKGAATVHDLIPLAPIFLLLTTAFVAALLSGLVGFGGALLLLPLLIHTVGTERAIPLLTLAQLVGNATRAWGGRHEIDWHHVRRFLLLALPATLLGAVAFLVLPKANLSRIIGVLILAAAALQWRQREGKQVDAQDRSSAISFHATSASTGFFSGLAGSAGPLSAAAFLSLNLAPGAYLASEACAALGIHLLKVAVYRAAIPLPANDLGLAAILSVIMIAGTLVGKRLVNRVPRHYFRTVVLVLLVAIGLKMLILA